jgi:hypothetical protein
VNKRKYMGGFWKIGCMNYVGQQTFGRKDTFKTVAL